MHTDADECISDYVSRENDLMQPDTTPTAAAARCIPNCIPEIPSDIPAQCGGNLQCGDFTGRQAVLHRGEEVKGRILHKVRGRKRPVVCVSDLNLPVLDRVKGNALQ